MATPAARGLGALGEEMARLYLAACGFDCVGSRERTRWGEIDLIARRGELLVFVEVKARRGTGWGRPEEAVTGAKQARLRRLAAAWLAEKRPPGCRVYRFDVVGLTFHGEGRGCTIAHVAGASPSLPGPR